MKFSGYIEGFYGRIFDWKTRIKIAKSVFEKGMNTYLYAPKEDKYHRVCWKEDYLSSESKNFAEIIEFSQKNGGEFIPALAPGLSYDFSDNDYKFLHKKIKYFSDLGAKSFALTMDDISTKSSGIMQGELLKKIKNDFPQLRILFCPTIYADDLVDENSLTYLDDLQKNIPDDIFILWTGESTISKRIDEKSLSYALKLFENRIVIWDNFYCNDYCPNRIFVGNYENRDREFLEKNCAGVLLNPTGLPITDEIILNIFAAWLKNQNCNIKNLLLSFGVPEKLLNYLPAISSPYLQNYELSKTFSAGDFFTEIVAKWQSPLKIEWYNALHAIFTEIRISTAEKPFSEEWFGMRYLPSLRNI